MKLIVVRHGETTDNVAGIIMGHRDGQLSSAGLEQAKKLGERLKHEKINCIYSSDLKRTKDTVAEIIKHHPDAPVIYDTLLREQSSGILEGQPKAARRTAQQESGISRERYRPEGGENMIDINRRAEKFIECLQKKHQDNETILICTHGGWKHAFMCSIWQIDPMSKVNQSLNFDNTAVTICELKEDGNHTVHLLNCTKHLS